MQNALQLPASHTIVKTLAPILQREDAAVDAWFQKHYAMMPAFFYSSVDVRHAGYKIAPVDTNLFPAGFNLMPQKLYPNVAQRMQQYLHAYHPQAKKILLIPENHTRNLMYLDNVAAIEKLLTMAGYQVRIGTLLPEEEILHLTSNNGSALIMHRVTRSGADVQAGGETPDLIILNNDLSSGVPELLKEATQPIIPSISVGWYQRSKSRHFEMYTGLAREFAAQHGIDPWLISTYFADCGDIDFRSMTGLECLATNVERVLKKIADKYQEYGITEQPYVFVKANHGTYGMGIMTVRSAEEVIELNKKQRNKMNVIKEGVTNTDVIIQEGVLTIDVVDGKVAEPLIYLVGGHAVSCTYRVNEERDAYSNLNASGMSFRDACQKDAEHGPSSSGLCPVQSLIARMAALAATKECYDANWDI